MTGAPSTPLDPVALDARRFVTFGDATLDIKGRRLFSSDDVTDLRRLQVAILHILIERHQKDSGLFIPPERLADAIYDNDIYAGGYKGRRERPSLPLAHSIKKHVAQLSNTLRCTNMHIEDAGVMGYRLHYIHASLEG